MLSANDIARYFLSLTEEDSGDGISNLKLQKLVYYAQGFYLAIYDEPLFNEDLVAWAHGPVVPELYQSYKEYGSNPIPIPQDVSPDIYPEDVKGLLDEIYTVYGQFSAWKLRDLTHIEPTWKDAYKQDAYNPIISRLAMKEYFKTRLIANGQEE